MKKNFDILNLFNSENLEKFVKIKEIMEESLEKTWRNWKNTWRNNATKQIKSGRVMEKVLKNLVGTLATVVVADDTSSLDTVWFIKVIDNQCISDGTDTGLRACYNPRF